MSEWNASPLDAGKPSREQLMAYVDGELSAPERAEIDRFRAYCSDTQNEIDALRELQRHCRAQSAPEPSEAQWRAVLRNVETSVIPRTEGRSGLRARRRLIFAGSAAALLLAAYSVFMGFSPKQDRAANETALVERDNDAPGKQGPKRSAPDSDEVGMIDLATNATVEINAIDAGDVDAIVLGEMPMSEPMELVASGRLVIDQMEPHPSDGMMPHFFLSEQGSPMLVVPVADHDLKE